MISIVDIVDIEQPAQLRTYLRQHNHIAAGEEVTFAPLPAASPTVLSW
jgi:hypothetical protein